MFNEMNGKNGNDKTSGSSSTQYGIAVFWAVCYKGVEMLFPSINSPGFIAFIISIIVSWLVGKTITLFILPLVGLAALLYSGYKVLNR